MGPDWVSQGEKPPDALGSYVCSMVHVEGNVSKRGAKEWKQKTLRKWCGDPKKPTENGLVRTLGVYPTGTLRAPRTVQQLDSKLLPVSMFLDCSIFTLHGMIDTLHSRILASSTDWDGVIMVDCYSGYTRLPYICRMPCWFWNLRFKSIGYSFCIELSFLKCGFVFNICTVYTTIYVSAAISSTISRTRRPFSEDSLPPNCVFLPRHWDTPLTQTDCF